jgi:hypothetical protein
LLFALRNIRVLHQQNLRKSLNKIEVIYIRMEYSIRIYFNIVKFLRKSFEILRTLTK